jgi:D-glycero-D-manno-heptose 1,7-bisphosphate phosphatase
MRIFLVNFAVINLKNNYLFDNIIRYLHKYNITKILIIKYKNFNINFAILKEYKINYNVVSAIDNRNLYQNLIYYKNFLPNFFFSIDANYFLNFNLFDLQLKYKKKPNKFFYFGNNFHNFGLYLFDKRKINFYQKIAIRNFKSKNCIKIKHDNSDLLVLDKKITERKIIKYFNKIYLKTIILDRDGVINENYGYVGEIKKFKWVEGAIQTIKYFNKKKYNIFIITNQSGVARGFFSETKVQILHQFIKDQLSKNYCYINQIYYCPFHPKAKIKKYKKNSINRKPKIGLFLKIKKNWFINSKNTFMIGDQNSDIEFAKNCKIKGFLFNEKNLFKFTQKYF